MALTASKEKEVQLLSSRIKKINVMDNESNDINGERIVRLNVGGTKFETTNRILIKSGYFRNLLSIKSDDKKNTERHYFIDRNGEYFRYLLDFMTLGEVCFPAKLAKMIKREANFYEVDMILDKLDDIIEKQQLSNFLLIVMSSGTNDNSITLNGKDIKDQCSKWNLNPQNKLTWTKLLTHLITNFGYEVTQHLAYQKLCKTGTQHIIYLKKSNDNEFVEIKLK